MKNNFSNILIKLLVLVGLFAGTVSAANFSDNHNDGALAGWTSIGYSWGESNGMATPNSVGDAETFLINDNDVRSDGTLIANIESNAWNGQVAGVVFRHTSTSSFYYVSVLPANEWSSKLSFSKNNFSTDTSTTIASGFSIGENFELKIEMNGSNFKFYLDGQFVAEVNDSTNTSGKIGYAYSKIWSKPVSFDNISWTEDAAEYSLTAAAAGNGTVTPDSGIYAEGTVVEITAAPSAGWHFVEWTGDISGSTNPASVTMSADKNITALFAQDILNYSLTAAATGNGTVTPDSGVYAESTVVEITAVPDTGWHFIGWTGDISGSTNPVSVTMSADKNITALFAQDTAVYSLTTITRGEGSVTPDSGVFSENTVVEITAIPDSGSHFVGWIGDTTGTTNPISVTMTADKNITALFAQDVFYYALNTAVTGNGTVTPDTGVFHGNRVVEVTATPDSGWHFVEWSGDISGSENPISITMSSEKHITAVFGQDNGLYSLTTTVTGNGSVSPDTGSFAEGTVVEITATPDTGWHFVGWTGDISGTVNPASVTMSANKSITALFAQNPAGAPNSSKISIAAKLYDNSGNPVGASAPELLDMKVKLFNAENGGTVKYIEEFTGTNAISVENGYFVIRLLEGISQGNLRQAIVDNADLWVEISVGTITLPRVPLTASAYSIK